MNRMNVKDSKATDRKYNLIYIYMVHINAAWRWQVPTYVLRYNAIRMLYIDYLHVSTETIYDVSTYIISINIGLKKNRSKYSAFPPGSDYLWSLKAYTIHNTYISPSIFIGSFCLINNQSYVAVCKIEKQTNQTIYSAPWFLKIKVYFKP